MEVTRAGKTLPISAVPNLQSGDKLAIRAEFSKQQAVHYLLVAAFLRGSTNPPPENWFSSSETWNPKQSRGLQVEVPAGAEQLLIFLAPETGGAMRTLISAVRGRPGAFVRASQDLNEASLERARLNVYLTAVRKIGAAEPDRLKTVSPLLTRSLGLKLNADCLDKTLEQQASCLAQGRESLILNDGHSTSVVSSLTSGDTGNLIANLSVTPKAGMGYYSPYVASVVDMARILDSFHTAQYQYIPALGTEEGKELSLELNTPPSFYNPKSVLVLALPAIQEPQMPPLRPVDPKSVYCAGKSDLVLQVEGAPLVFATGYAHELVLRLKRKDGKTIEAPLSADAEKGGLVAAGGGFTSADLGDALVGSIHGYWGFEPFDGPEFHLENAHPEHWRSAEDEVDLVAGSDATLHLQTDSAACVESVTLQSAAGQSFKAEWKPEAPNRIEVALPLKKLKPGPFKLLIGQFGSKDPDAVALHAYAPAGRVDAFVFHLGDTTAVLKGARLEEIKEVKVKDAVFRPVGQPAETGELTLSLVDPKGTAAWKAGDSFPAEISLEDGRALHLETTVASPRPSAGLLAKSTEPEPAGESIRFRLTDPDEVAAGALLTFSLQARVPAEFTGTEKVEVAAGQGGALGTLSANNGLIMEDSRILLATLDTAKMLPPSAAGSLRFRLVEDGIDGDWQPLATLVRLPLLQGFTCYSAPTPICTLSGSALFLIDSISADAQFSIPVQVPAGYPGFTLSLPRPAGNRLYVKLHDAPSTVNEIELPAEAAPASPAAAPPNSGQPAASTPATPQPGGLPAPDTPQSSTPPLPVKSEPSQ